MVTTSKIASFFQEGTKINFLSSNPNWEGSCTADTLCGQVFQSFIRSRVELTGHRPTTIAASSLAYSAILAPTANIPWSTLKWYENRKLQNLICVKGNWKQNGLFKKETRRQQKSVSIDIERAQGTDKRLLQWQTNASACLPTCPLLLFSFM